MVYEAKLRLCLHHLDISQFLFTHVIVLVQSRRANDLYLMDC